MSPNRATAHHWSLLLTLLIWTLPLAADPGLTPPQQVIERVSDGLRRVLREDRDRLASDPQYVYRLVDELLVPNIDVARLSALALGPVWREATPAQREAFAEELKRTLIRTYATAVDALGEWQIQYLPTPFEPDQERAVVRTRIRRPGGEPISVDYRMARRGERWLAYDVAIEGVSLLVNYRSTFVRLAREKGVDGLIEELARHNAERAEP
ncbi:ABC-type transport system involved in resistance to organic solvents, auxiliary component [Thioflavicoccus mobilis 8321]|uniref:ABC-type transport system involved in resistance to organic solvents, auxiliary component n=1 Tax=Thioflavicoccus mobilis 8321 TaxID=765912 RepID=L0GSQ9_9GAMM|nr:ABC transporter substrate-binding protein [Thioflavicoccus mobilis]AGA89006.1 ABC-type transport system involved in resistance to organic solvents, auxiliary component [Thioflavicoccus mobilis 8321]